MLHQLFPAMITHGKEKKSDKLPSQRTLGTLWMNRLIEGGTRLVWIAAA